MIGDKEVSEDHRQQKIDTTKVFWLSNNNNSNNKSFQGGLCHAVCLAGGAGFVVCWVGSAFYRWALPLHVSRVAFRVLSSILGENASAATIWWPFSGNRGTDAFHFKQVAIQLRRHNLLPFVLNGYSFTCAATILRPFLFAVTLRVLEAARAAVPPPSRGCSINAYKTL